MVEIVSYCRVIQLKRKKIGCRSSGIYNIPTSPWLIMGTQHAAVMSETVSAGLLKKPPDLHSFNNMWSESSVTSR